MRSLLFLLCVGSLAAAPSDPGPFVRALWLFQRRGAEGVAGPEGDARLKGQLFKAMDKSGSIRKGGVLGLMEPETFDRLAGTDGQLDAEEVRAALDADAPPSRATLNPALREHLDALTTGFDLVSERHRDGAKALGEWIARRYQAGQPLHVITVCTGNTRRSVLSAMMGNAAAAYYGFPEIRFHSGGTAPDAVNPRTITALRAVGFAVEPTGREATRGKADVANPYYQMSWGRPSDPATTAVEFSKTYGDPANPSSGFAALMVCGEADEACPFVKGADARISLPFLDPKLFDGSPYETVKYAERRDDIGRVLLSAMLHARRILDGVNAR